MPSDDFPREARFTQTLGGVAGTGTVSYPIPDPGAWYLAAVFFRLVTDATVATRTPLLSILGGDGLPVAVTAGGYGATANTTVDYAFVQGLAEWDQSNNAAASGPAPQVPLLPGDVLTITLGAGVAGDAISRVHVSLAKLQLGR